MISIYNPDFGCRVLYPTDQSSELKIEVDVEIRKLWNAIHMPSNRNDLDRQLHSAGHISKSQLGQKGVVGTIATKKSRKRKGANAVNKRRRQNITNTHLVDQLPWLSK